MLSKSPHVFARDSFAEKRAYSADSSVQNLVHFLNEANPNDLLPKGSHSADQFRDCKRAALTLNVKLPAYQGAAEKLFLKLQASPGVQLPKVTVSFWSA